MLEETLHMWALLKHRSVLVKCHTIGKRLLQFHVLKIAGFLSVVLHNVD